MHLYDVETQILADLESGDPQRQTQSLLILIQRQSVGSEVVYHIPTIVSNCLVQGDNRVVRKLAYVVMRGSTECPDQTWETAMPVILKDLQSEDAEIRIAALRILNGLPTEVLRSFFKQGGNDLLDINVRRTSEYVRRAAVDTVGGLVLAELPIAEFELYKGWAALCDACLDKDGVVAEAGMRLMHTFLSSCAVQDEDSIPPKRKLILQKVGQWLIGNIQAVLARCLALDVHQRWCCVLPLVHTCKLMKEQANTQVDLANLNKLVNNIMDEQLLPLMSSGHVSLVYESGHGMLKLARYVEENQSTWVLAVITSFLRVINTEDGGIDAALFVKDIVEHAHLVESRHLMAVTAQLLVAIRRLPDTKERLVNLVIQLKAVISVTVQSKRNITSDSSNPHKKSTVELPSIHTLFSNRGFVSIWADEVQTEKDTFREELACALFFACLSMSPFSSKSSLTAMTDEDSLKWMATALDVAELCMPCLCWDSSGRPYAANGYLKVLLQVCLVIKYYRRSLQASSSAQRFMQMEERTSSEQRALKGILQQCDQILVHILKLTDKITSDAVKTRVLWILVHHINLTPDMEKDGSTLLAYHLRQALHGVNRTEEIARTWRKRCFELGTLGVVVAANDLMQNQLRTDFEVILHCLAFLCFRYRHLRDGVKLTVEELGRRFKLNQTVVDSCRAMLQSLELFQTSRKTLLNLESTSFSRDYFIEAEVPFHDLAVSSAGSELADIDDILYASQTKRNARQISFEHLTKSVTLPPSKKNPPKIHPPTLVTGDSDLCAVEISHDVDPQNQTITMYIYTQNVAEFDLVNVTIALGIKGHLEFVDNASKSSHEVSYLASGQSTLWKMNLTATAFDENICLVRLMFSESDSGSDAFLSTHIPTMTVYCHPYSFSPNDFLKPDVRSRRGFQLHWTRMTARFVRRAVVINGQDFTAVEKAMEGKAFAKVFSKHYKFCEQYQAAYTAVSWFGDYLAFTLTGCYDHNNKEWVMHIEFRGSADSAIVTIHENFSTWFANITDSQLRIVKDHEEGVAFLSTSTRPSPTSEVDRWLSFDAGLDATILNQWRVYSESVKDLTEETVRIYDVVT